MNVYGTKQIRNVVLLGHGGAGKTTVAEALALVTGVTKRMGKVPEGSTISDYDKEEIKRQFSISTTLIPLEYDGEDGPIKINLLDTPGYFDFVGEVEEAVSVADAAIIVVNCKAGIEVGTEKAWELCEEYNLPRIIFVTNMDDDQASFRELILKLEKRFGRKIAPFQVPIRENEKFVGFVNVVKMKGRRFTNLSDYEECEIPEYTKKESGYCQRRSDRGGCRDERGIYGTLFLRRRVYSGRDFRRSQRACYGRQYRTGTDGLRYQCTGLQPSAPGY